MPYDYRRFFKLDHEGQRDSAWLQVGELCRQALRQQGYRCMACGAFMWSRAGGQRLYCNDTCRNRAQRRRDRFRQLLREQDHQCPLCGGDGGTDDPRSAVTKRSQAHQEAAGQPTTGRYS